MYPQQIATGLYLKDIHQRILHSMSAPKEEETDDVIEQHIMVS